MCSVGGVGCVGGCDVGIVYRVTVGGGVCVVCCRVGYVGFGIDVVYGNIVDGICGVGVGVGSGGGIVDGCCYRVDNVCGSGYADGGGVDVAVVCGDGGGCDGIVGFVGVGGVDGIVFDVAGGSADIHDVDVADGVVGVDDGIDVGVVAECVGAGVACDKIAHTTTQNAYHINTNHQQQE